MIPKANDNSTALQYLALLTIVLLAVYTYTYKVTGINASYDDAIYAYSIIQASSLRTTTFFMGSFGFHVFGYPFVMLLGHSLIVPTIITICAIVITLLVIFQIGRFYGSAYGGLFGAALYAFNPLIFTYSNRLIPDIFTTMLLSISVLTVLHAERGRSVKRYALSGFIVALGMFFGVQALFSVLAYFPFLITGMLLSNHKRKTWHWPAFWKCLAFAVSGVAASLALWLLLLQTPHFNPISALSRMWRAYEGVKQYPWSQAFYPNIIFPFFATNTGIKSGTAEPYTNMGLLGLIFIAANVVAFGNRRRRILPYSASVLITVLYLMYGTQSALSYTHVYDINRLLIPVVFLASSGIASIVSLAPKSKFPAKLFCALTLGIVISSYLIYAIPIYEQAITYNNVNGYQSLMYLQGMLPYQRMSNYTIYQDVLSVPNAICFIFDTNNVSACKGIPKQGIQRSTCGQNNTLIYSLEPICNESALYSAYGRTIYIHFKD